MSKSRDRGGESMRQRIRNKRQYQKQRVREREAEQEARRVRQQQFIRRWQSIQKEDIQPVVTVPQKTQPKRSGIWNRILRFLRWR